MRSKAFEAPGSPGPSRAPIRGAVRIRTARISDLPRLVAHRRAMFFAIGGFSERDLAKADPVYRRWLRGRLRSGTAHALVAVVAGRPVGSAVSWLREDQPRPGWPSLRVPYILSVYVDPAQRGRGIASRLTKELVDWAIARGYPRSILHASTFGRSLYRKLGFRRTWEMRFGGPYRSGPAGRHPRDRPLRASGRSRPRGRRRRTR